MTHLIYSDHNVFVDDFEEGEKDHVNFYENNAQVKAENLLQAIELYITEKLYYTFKKEYLYLDEGTHVIHYDVLVDNDQQELTEIERKQWEKGEITAYANRFEMQVYEINKVELKDVKLWNH
ncbi:hypothetical protein [Aquimarina algiphila]|uniref:Uncharacterized protein n=1 Tax=Aquimarina algiphila TaxID=2047982 RepID=A0A554VRQ4_9FLAO|nr:hypothetical protein [Aquimarina algiphila]TSE11326.1 hypothetical protein FOF46_01465 [Aquimarina algiphila]